MDCTLAHDPGAHVVQFYDSDPELVTSVVDDYLVATDTGSVSAVAITTPEHRRGIVSGLALHGVDVAAEVRAGRLLLLDAAATLEQFTVDGSPDPSSFHTIVGGAIRAAGADGQPVRAYGEMVAVLWAAGNVTGALELEALWTALSEELAFSLVCSYPAELMRDAAVATELAQVCRLHTAVASAPADAQSVAVSRRFARSSVAPREARRFTRDTLDAWSLNHLIDDCLLVVTELATNAVRHADSPFTVSMSHMQGAVHVAVGDGSSIVAEVRTPDAPGEGGRGLHLVGAVSRQWGQSVAHGGKLVWAVVGAG